MFTRKQTPQAPHATTSLIAHETHITGDIRFSGGLCLDGKIDGRISATESDAVLTLGDRGVVRGDIDGATVIIHGKVHGDIRATKRVELAASARITGNVHYASIVVVAGAQVNGRLCHLGSNAEEQTEPAHPYLASAISKDGSHPRHITGEPIDNRERMESDAGPDNANVTAVSPEGLTGRRRARRQRHPV